MTLEQEFAGIKKDLKKALLLVILGDLIIAFTCGLVLGQVI